MESKPTQRKAEPHQPTPVEKDGDTQPPVPEGARAPRQQLHRKIAAWFRKHPGMALAILVFATYVLILRNYSKLPSGVVMFNKDTLAAYNGKKNSPLYLAILGEVFDVTKGRRLYGEEKGYGGFVGRDGTRAFVTGDFTPRGLIDDVEGLSPEQLKSLIEWRAFYHKQYTFKGRLVGPFYDGAGRPTRLLRRVEEDAAKAKSEEELQREAEAKWPSCNVRWTESEGGTVWCDGGAYPRKVFLQLPGGKPTTKCACFAELGWSDIRQVYPDCAPDATSCKV
ncbi:hypothetical protein PLESTB_001592300 [Pleodorina starrii]|uniref:Cytochrome b5 heme-binding domain-containing protein n=1 Tax=Pleodorina starrii TaxID=330485 RepID=A0A9W6BYS0_9CHLO|nr:hypothetical protein PLESTB_001592300 [Pleodorina starrii]GLC66027.1 hypothetical protein PLESTF_000373900 [Pleodorina starrii]